MIPAAFDLWSTAPWIEADVVPSGIPYGIVLSKVRPVSLAEALEWRAQLEAQHLDTFATLLREYKAVTEAQAAGRPLTLYGGRPPPAPPRTTTAPWPAKSPNASACA